MKRLLLAPLLLASLFGCSFEEKKYTRINYGTYLNEFNDSKYKWAELSLYSKPTIESEYSAYSNKRYPLKINIYCRYDIDWINITFSTKKRFLDYLFGFSDNSLT